MHISDLLPFRRNGSLERTAEAVEKKKAEVSSLTDERLAGKTEEFRKALARGSSLDSILPEVFAVAGEASRRVLGLDPYRVQYMGGIALHRGYIAQMNTGEGKTLAAVPPVYLNALEGKGVHVVTVNDYLARRDAENMGRVYRFLGLTVGVVTAEMKTAERKAAYACDVTYVTNSELGFDYLRDNLARKTSDIVLRGLHYAVIDEADSILIDEARTPLIISSGEETSFDIYRQCDAFAKTMVRGEDMPEFTKADILAGAADDETGDFILNEKEKLWSITERGTHAAEKYFGIGNYADEKNIYIRHGIDNAVRANYLMRRDRDYIVRDGAVLIVDPFTGRVLDGHRFSDGLHQAIEAKEGVEITAENKTLATVTYQSFFNKFDKKSGMTGTAVTEKDEFIDVYGMDVVVIPPNRPVQRVDLPDIVYRTKKDKYAAVVSAACGAYKRGQPVLIGTASIDVSETISDMLDKKGVPHNVLNAKNHEREAAIVEDAGRHGAVTVATDMAGRGTDIKPDKDALEAGGLLVIGTERHESRRIDDQLRGRSGRQGDVGCSRFYISLEDDLMRLFGRGCGKVFDAFGIEEGEGISDRSLTKVISDAQRRIESMNFAARKSVMDYDAVLNEQRDDIYEQRRALLFGDIDPVIFRMIESTAGGLADSLIPPGENSGWDLDVFNAAMHNVFFSAPISREDVSGMDHDKFKAFVIGRLNDRYMSFKSAYGEGFDTMVRNTVLSIIDAYWTIHLDSTEILLQSVGLQAYASRDPVLQYRQSSYELFNTTSWMIMVDSLTNIFGRGSAAEQRATE